MTTPDDAQDPRVAEWLAVEPLDDVTRARLVRAAMADADPDTDVEGGAAPAPRHIGRLLAAAAALLVVLVVGIAVLVPRGDESTPTAANAPADRKATPEAVRERAADSSGATAQAESAAPARSLPSLGELGDVSTETALREATAARARLTYGSATTPPVCAVEAARSLGEPIAAGTGTVDGQRATVILVQRADGLHGAISVIDRSCRAVASTLFP